MSNIHGFSSKFENDLIAVVLFDIINGHEYILLISIITTNGVNNLKI